MGSVYLEVVFNLFYTLLGSIYVKVIKNLFYTLLLTKGYFQSLLYLPG